MAPNQKQTNRRTAFLISFRIPQASMRSQSWPQSLHQPIAIFQGQNHDNSLSKRLIICTSNDSGGRDPFALEASHTDGGGGVVENEGMQYPQPNPYLQPRAIFLRIFRPQDTTDTGALEHPKDNSSPHWGSQNTMTSEEQGQDYPEGTAPGLDLWDRKLLCSLRIIP